MLGARSLRTSSQGILAEAWIQDRLRQPRVQSPCTAKASQDPAILVLNAFKEDCEKSGWRTCS